jgi:hypothetical protein
MRLLEALATGYVLMRWLLLLLLFRLLLSWLPLLLLSVGTTPTPQGRM